MGKSCSFGQQYVLFIMSICSFGCFQFWFRGQNIGSDFVSSWSLLTFYLVTCKNKEDPIKKEGARVAKIVLPL